MLNSIRDLLRLVGFSVLEVWLQVTAVIVSLILLCLKVEDYQNTLSLSWALVLIPMFVADALCAYFSLIVFIRALGSGEKKGASKRLVWVIICLVMLILFKVLLINKLDQNLFTSPASVITAPIFTLWFLYFGRSCKVT